jgi:3-oxoacyl-[acyl-carrier-protein] synthase III
MAITNFRNIGLTGLAAAVPANRYINFTDNPNFSPEDAKAIIGKTGIVERRVANASTTASDLAYAAAEAIINKMAIAKSEIDVLILVTQTPDYRMPASSIILQDRLGLQKSCLAFDVNLGCSGFVVGLNIAYSLCNQPSIRKVLLLNGETRSKVYSFKDRQTGFLFGDAASAAIIEKDEKFGHSFFKADSDGAKSNYIMAKSGGYRNPSTPESFVEKEQESGRFHSDEQGSMDGAGVFEFVITQVPRHIKEILKIAGKEKEDMDAFVLHQANKFMNDHLIKKLKLDPEKVPYSLNKFGNTSSVSIPLTMVTNAGLFTATKQLIISGFGVGLSLGSAFIQVKDLIIPPLVEVV